jgi:hypothetical protein
MLDKVKALHDAGFDVILLYPKSKKPIGNDWSEKRRASWAALQRRYKQEMNIGVRLGAHSKVEGGYVHCIDLDIRLAESAPTARLKLKEVLDGVNLKTLPMVRSGSGGDSRHLYFITDKPLRSCKLARGSKKIIGPDGRPHLDYEIELLGTGKQVVLPPSIHPYGGGYEWDRQFDFEAYDLGMTPPFIPSDLFEGLDADDEEVEAKEPLGLTLKEAEGLLEDLPLDWCDDHDQWFRVGMALHHEFSGADEALALWVEWSKKSDKFDASVFKGRWRSFGKSKRVVTMATIVSVAREARRDALIDQGLANLYDEDDEEDEEAKSETARLLKMLPDLPDEDEDDNTPKWVSAFNKTHCVAIVGNKAVIVKEDGDDTLFMRPADFRTYYQNLTHLDDQGKRRENSQVWMAHKKRRTVKRVVFSPRKTPKSVYNLFKGWAVVPSDETSCKLILRHIREVCCRGNEEHANWLLDWSAHLFQKPWEKPGVAVVMRGLKGVGKDTWGNYLGRIIGHKHHIKVSKEEHIYGQFNNHIARAMLLHCEEATWAGDKKNEGPLKNLITDARQRIEPKGIDSFEVDSFFRVFMSSNADWVVPATPDERRFFVLDVSDKYRRNPAYFVPLNHEMDHGGPEALLAFLLARDISKFDPRNPPITEGLLGQIETTLKGFDAYWYQVLTRGDQQGPHGLDDLQGWETTGVNIVKQDLFQNYHEWGRRPESKYLYAPIGEKQIGARMGKVCPSYKNDRPTENGRRVRRYLLPPLAQCRKDFEKFMGGPVHWDD